MTTTVSSKGQIVLPANLRKKYHLEPGTSVRIVEREGKIQIEPTGLAVLQDLVGSFDASLRQEIDSLKADEKQRSRI